MAKTGAPQRIGVVLAPARKLNEPALRFLVLAMNKEQDLFQFEFYNLAAGDPLLAMLGKGQNAVRATAREQLPDFVTRAREHIVAKPSGWGCPRTRPTDS